MIVKILPNPTSTPPGKLADAELHFDSGPLAGLKLIGFHVWERRDRGYNVTFPARQYSVNGERRSFALLRPIADFSAQKPLSDVILAAYAAYVAAEAAEQAPVVNVNERPVEDATDLATLPTRPNRRAGGRGAR